MKSGVTHLGYKTTLKATREGKSQLLVVSSNCPALHKSVLEYHALLGKVGIYYYTGNNRELGTACGKLFPVSVLTIENPGDSDILKTIDA